MFDRLPKTPLIFFTNLAVWMFCCMLAQFYHIISTGRSLNSQLTKEDHDYLVGLVDQRLLWFILIGCLILIALVAIIGHLAGTIRGHYRTQQMLSQVLAESASALLNFGSLLAGISFVTTKTTYIAGSIFCWIAWLIFKPKEDRYT